LLYYINIDMFAVFPITSLLSISKGIYVLSHVVAQSEKRSHYLLLTGVIY